MTLFRKIIDDATAERLTDNIGLHVLGEPLLHPEIIDAIGYASARGLRVGVTTNGSLLDRERVRRLSAAGLSRLVISLVTSDRDEHSARHAKQPRDDYYDGVLAAIGAARELDPPLSVGVRVMSTWTSPLFSLDRMEKVRLNDSTVVWRGRVASLMSDLARCAGCDLSHDEIRDRLAGVDMRRDCSISIVDGLDVMLRTFGDWGNAFSSRTVHPAHVGYCSAAKQTASVLSNGVVVACCVDHDGHTPLGNVNEQSLGDILRGPTLQRMMDGFGRYRVVEPGCQRCLGASSRTAALLKGLATIVLFKRRDPVRRLTIEHEST